jgi:hypothetical protein
MGVACKNAAAASRRRRLQRSNPPGHSSWRSRIRFLRCCDALGGRGFRPFSALPVELKPILTDQISWGRKARKDEDRVRLKALVDSADDKKRAATQRILEVLFPPARAVFSGRHFEDTSQETRWVVGLRIASEKHFDVPSDEVSEDELQDLLGKIPDR